jgi:hypothetical protein
MPPPSRNTGTGVYYINQTVDGIIDRPANDAVRYFIEPFAPVSGGLRRVYGVLNIALLRTYQVEAASLNLLVSPLPGAGNANLERAYQRIGASISSFLQQGMTEEQLRYGGRAHRLLI